MPAIEPDDLEKARVFVYIIDDNGPLEVSIIEIRFREEFRTFLRLLKDGKHRHGGLGFTKVDKHGPATVLYYQAKSLASIRIDRGLVYGAAKSRHDYMAGIIVCN